MDELCTEDVTLLPPDHPACNGRAEALAYLNEYPHMEAFTASLTSLHGRGDTGVGVGGVASRRPLLLLRGYEAPVASIFSNMSAIIWLRRRSTTCAFAFALDGSSWPTATMWQVV